MPELCTAVPSLVMATTLYKSFCCCSWLACPIAVESVWRVLEVQEGQRTTTTSNTHFLRSSIYKYPMVHGVWNCCSNFCCSFFSAAKYDKWEPHTMLLLPSLSLQHKVACLCVSVCECVVVQLLVEVCSTSHSLLSVKRGLALGEPEDRSHSGTGNLRPCSMFLLLFLVLRSANQRSNGALSGMDPTRAVRRERERGLNEMYGGRRRRRPENSEADSSSSSSSRHR